MRQRRRLAGKRYGRLGQETFDKYFAEMIENLEEAAERQGSSTEEMSDGELEQFIERNFDNVIPPEAIHLVRALLPSRYKTLLYLEYGFNPDDSDWAEVNTRLLDRY